VPPPWRILIIGHRVEVGGHTDALQECIMAAVVRSFDLHYYNNNVLHITVAWFAWSAALASRYILN